MFVGLGVGGISRGSITIGLGASSTLGMTGFCAGRIWVTLGHDGALLLSMWAWLYGGGGGILFMFGTPIRGCGMLMGVCCLGPFAMLGCRFTFGRVLLVRALWIKLLLDDGVGGLG